MHTSDYNTFVAVWVFVLKVPVSCVVPFYSESTWAFIISST